MVAQVKRRDFSVAEFHQMGAAGVFADGERVELVEGGIVVMAPIGAAHAGLVDLLADRLKEQLGRRAIVRVQNPLRLSDDSEPQPDIALVNPRDDYYTRAHPGPSDVLLVIEVAETSLAYDREIKVPVYARAGVPEVWVIDARTRRTLVYAEPSGDGYAVVLERAPGEALVPRAFGDVAVSVGG